MTANHVFWQFMRHAAVGGSGVVINYVLFGILRHHYGYSTLTSTLIVHCVLLLYIFPLQKYFTYFAPLETWQQIRRFMINDAIYITSDFSLAWLIIDFFGVHPWIGKIVALAMLTPMSFMIQRKWVFQAS